MALVAELAEQLQCLVREFGRVCKQWKLRVNVDKSKVVVVVVYPRRVFEESTACIESCLHGFSRKVSPVLPTMAVLLCVWG